MLLMRNLTLISVQSWTYLTERCITQKSESLNLPGCQARFHQTSPLSTVPFFVLPRLKLKNLFEEEYVVSFGPFHGLVLRKEYKP